MSWEAELLVQLVSTYLTQAASYFIIVGLVYWVTRKWAAALLAKRRIPVQGRALDGAQLRHEVGHSAVVLAFGAVQLAVITQLQRLGYIRLPEDLGSWGVGGALLAIFLLMIGNDLWFYLVHRALHTPFLFRHVHKVHHRSVDLNPLTSYSFHLLEAVLITGWLLPVLLFVPIPLPVIGVVQVLGLSNNVMAHLGYELLPRWWVKVPVLRWSNSATFHALHHQRSMGNYGLFTRLWDRLFGTELSGYEQAFVREDAPPQESEAAAVRGG